MIADNVLFFLIVIVALWINMAVAKAVAGIWLDDEKSTIASFAFILGTFTGVQQRVYESDGWFAGLAGTVVGFALLWWIHFGRQMKAKRASHG